MQQYWQSLFKDDPETREAFQHIQIEFRRGQYTSAIEGLQGLLEQSSDAPWREAVSFYLAQAWKVLQQYEDALRQLDDFLDRYPDSPAVPRALLHKAEIYLAMGKEPKAPDRGAPSRDTYLKKARDLFKEVAKRYPGDERLQAEARYYLGGTYFALRDYDRAKKTFRMVADEFEGTAFPTKALYSLAGVYLGVADVEGAERIFSEILERFPKSLAAEKARKKLKGLRLVGTDAPPLQVKAWIGEEPRGTRPYRGKLTVLSFWAIWCPHCRRNISRMEQIQETYAAKGVCVLGVSREREGYGIEKIRAFINTHQMNYPTAIDDEGKTSEAMAVTSIPCVVVVDSRGRICWYGHPDYLSDKAIDTLLERSS